MKYLAPLSKKVKIIDKTCQNSWKAYGGCQNPKILKEKTLVLNTKALWNLDLQDLLGQHTCPLLFYYHRSIKYCYKVENYEVSCPSLPIIYFHKFDIDDIFHKMICKIDKN